MGCLLAPSRSPGNSMSPSCHESFICRSPARIMIRFMEESSRPVVANRALRAAMAAALCAWVVSIPAVGAENAPHAIVGAWALNRNLSDLPDERFEGGASGRPQGAGSSRGGRGRGAYGGGGFPGSGGHSNSQETAHRQEALREFIDAPGRLTIVETDNTIILTKGDGHTTHLTPDGKKMKDASSGLERQTEWENGKLVSKISGSLGKVTETYSVDTDHHELLVITRIESSEHQDRARVFHRLYSAEVR